jgi:hypothetical protein
MMFDKLAPHRPALAEYDQGKLTLSELKLKHVGLVDFLE